MSSTTTITTTIQLIGSNELQAPRVTWDPSTVDNELMNKKKSKSCCIFHRKRSWDSSDDNDSDSDSDSDSGNAYEPKTKKKPRIR